MVAKRRANDGATWRGSPMRVGQGLKFAMLLSAAAIVCAPGPVAAAPKAKGPSTSELAARVKSLEEA
ncbi:MAG: hypothetical protein EBZ50_09745, partial [Alphaproteobacteria bacterium]|nr:hypothetical protein [Alphaproteobacteria bacterium]